jgi:hypothetical protein
VIIKEHINRDLHLQKLTVDLIAQALSDIILPPRKTASKEPGKVIFKNGDQPAFVLILSLVTV